MELPSVEIKKILYPTDLSENARYAFTYAVNLAHLHGAELVILHVLEQPGQIDPRLRGYVNESQWESINSQAVEEAWTTLTGKRKGVAEMAVGKALSHFHRNTVRALNYSEEGRVDIALEEGLAAETILEQVEKRGCDLVVMGTYGERSLLEAMVGVGRTAAKVVRKSPVPVLVVRLPQR